MTLPLDRLGVVVFLWKWERPPILCRDGVTVGSPPRHIYKQLISGLVHESRECLQVGFLSTYPLCLLHWVKSPQTSGTTEVPSIRPCLTGHPIGTGDSTKIVTSHRFFVSVKNLVVVTRRPGEVPLFPHLFWKAFALSVRIDVINEWVNLKKNRRPRCFQHWFCLVRYSR